MDVSITNRGLVDTAARAVEVVYLSAGYVYVKRIFSYIKTVFRCSGKTAHNSASSTEVSSEIPFAFGGNCSRTARSRVGYANGSECSAVEHDKIAGVCTKVIHCVNNSYSSRSLNIDGRFLSATVNIEDHYGFFRASAIYYQRIVDLEVYVIKAQAVSDVDRTSATSEIECMNNALAFNTLLQALEGHRGVISRISTIRLISEKVFCIRR